MRRIAFALVLFVPVCTWAQPLIDLLTVNGLVSNGLERTEISGTLLIASIQASDTPVIMAIILVFSILVVFFTLIADVLDGFLDPRVRYS